MPLLRYSALAGSLLLTLVCACSDDATSPATPPDAALGDTHAAPHVGVDADADDDGYVAPDRDAQENDYEVAPRDLADSGDLAPDEPTLCAAIRGNGQLITAHFPALARIVEHYGPISGAAGGSSASITTFFLESIQMNPFVEDCGGQRCTLEESSARISLMLKSILGYIAGLGTTEEALAVQAILPVIQEIQDADIAGLLDTDVDAALDALQTILESDDLGDLINPEVLALLSETENPLFHIGDLLTAIGSFGSFSAEDPLIFVRPGLIDFAAFGRKLARVANFYAGYGPIDEAGFQNFLSSCAADSVGLSWAEIAELSVGENTCGELFGGLFLAYRTTLLADEESFPTRADDPVGGSMQALISTSVLTGDAVAEFQAARAAYNDALEVTLDVAFSDVSFGYWGSADDLATVASNPEGYNDEKTLRFRSLGSATWGEVLALSPAEPGLARALEITDDEISAGGWSDLHPTLALRNLGCEKIVYVTRTGNESAFAQGVATLFGMSIFEKEDLYDLDNANSSYALSLAEADAVWCTDWDQFGGTELLEIAEDAYDAPMESSDPYFTDPSGANGPYDGLESSIGLRGCTPGASD